MTNQLCANTNGSRLKSEVKLREFKDGADESSGCSCD